MKNLIVAIALIIAQSALAQPLDRTQEYRVWSAEQMINRLTETFARTLTQCQRAQHSVWMAKAGEECEKVISKSYPNIIENIRESARSGNEVWWANVVDIVHDLERTLDAPKSK